MNLVKPRNNFIRKYMCKAARLSSGVESLNPPCRWRGKQLHQHGGDVRRVFVLCVVVSSGCLVPEHNLKVCILP